MSADLTGGIVIPAEVTGEPAEIGEARARVGRAMRRLGHAVVGRHAPTQLLHHVAQVLEGLTANLEPGERRARERRTWGYGNAPDIPIGTAIPCYPDRPISGIASPHGVEMTAVRTAEGVEATVVLGRAHEGAPDRCHGGIVAAIFDDLTGFLLPVTRTSAYTGELTVRYLAGVPIGEPVRFRAWERSREGRKVYFDGEAHVGDQCVATAKTIYITVDPSA